MTIALLLPGMTLNRTIFPPLPVPTIATEFTELDLGPDGSSPALLERRMEFYADLLDRQVEATPAWKTAGRRIVVAHSFGGMLALGWWLKHAGRGPAKIDGLVLISSSPGPMFGAARLTLIQVGEFRIRVGLALFMKLWNRPGVTRTVKRLLSGGTLAARRVNFQARGHWSDAALDLAGWRNTGWRAMRSYRLALEGFDVRDRLAKISVPTIVLHGDRDTILPLDNGEALARGIRAAELRVIPGAGHALPLTHPEAVLGAVNDLDGRADGN